MAQQISLSPIDLVLKVAAASVGASEHPPNTNRGPYVERVLKVVGLPPGQPWCAAQVADTGVTALGRLWPLPLTGSCQALNDFALSHKIRFLKPERGDVFLVWHPELGRFAHTGFIETVGSQFLNNQALTLEGNTSGGGSREGWMKAERTRTFKPEDRFVRWVMLLP